MSTRPAHKRGSSVHRGRHRAVRPKTFSSEEKAKNWAQAKGIKSFDLVRLNSGISKKIEVVPK